MAVTSYGGQLSIGLLTIHRYSYTAQHQEKFGVEFLTQGHFKTQGLGLNQEPSKHWMTTLPQPSPRHWQSSFVVDIVGHKQSKNTKTGLSKKEKGFFFILQEFKIVRKQKIKDKMQG